LLKGREGGNGLTYLEKEVETGGKRKE